MISTNGRRHDDESPVRQPPAPRTSVLLADDHAVFREGLRALLECEPDLDVVGDAPDGRVAVDLALRLCPDVVVMDVAMPHLNGFDAARQILKAAPATRVLLLSAHCDAEYVAHAARVGVAGYVLKQSSLSELADAIRKAVHGQRSVAPQAAPHQSGTRALPTSCDGAPTAEVDRLTERETEVLQLLVESRGNKEIARELGISVKTVEKHRQSLMRKLDIHDVAGLTRYAVASGVVECCVGHASI